MSSKIPDYKQAAMNSQSVFSICYAQRHISIPNV